jgi:hypothetical protein
MKQLLLLSVLLIVTCAGFAQTSEKRLIDTAEVNYVELVKVNFTEPVKSEKKLLTKKQYNDFASKWNTSTYMGADKYKMKYYVYVILKDGSKRRFTTSGSSIQEEDWMTYDTDDKLYFDKLWEAIK